MIKIKFWFLLSLPAPQYKMDIMTKVRKKRHLMFPSLDTRTPMTSPLIILSLVHILSTQGDRIIPGYEAFFTSL